MAKQLEDFFKQAEALGGMKAKMRLALITNISSSKAASEMDSPENISKFEKAITEIKKEFS